MSGVGLLISNVHAILAAQHGIFFFDAGFSIVWKAAAVARGDGQPPFALN